MKRCFIAAWTGFMVYSLLLCVTGPAGLDTARRLESEHAAISANLDQLGAINRRLESMVKSYSSDRETIRVEARSLGFIEEGEKIVAFGAARPRRESEIAGRIMRTGEGNPTQAVLPVISGMLAAFAVFILLGLARGMDASRKR